jgi:hypothetical protein
MNRQEKNDGVQEPRDERVMTYRSEPFEVAPKQTGGDPADPREAAERGYGWGV